MTLFHSHSGRLPTRGRGRRFSIAGTLGLLGAAFKTMHDAIVAAKLQRLRSELMFHERWPVEPGADAKKVPRRPAFLSDKWDF